MARTLNLKVVGENKMNCGGCERSVTATLLDLPGVETVRADRTTQDIDVSLASDETTLEEIKAELNEIGYEVEAA
ncbi:MAG: cation transporter [Chloroflexota bacterium]|nr:cation transporter [Chloroflexota bacterium]